MEIMPQNDYKDHELDLQEGLSIQTQSAIEILKRIQKHVAVLLLIILVDPRPVGESLISGILGIDRKTARGHLKGLSQLNCIARSGHFEGFILTQGGRQLILPVDSSLGRNSPLMGKNSPSFPSSSATTLNRKVGKIEGKIEEEEYSLGKNYPIMGDISPLNTEIDTQLMNLGIGKNKREQIMNLNYLTPEMIKNKIADLRQRGKYSTGLLIFSLLNDPPPAAQKINSDPEIFDYLLPPQRKENNLSGLIDNPVWFKLIGALDNNQKLRGSLGSYLAMCQNIDLDDEFITFTVGDSYSRQWLNENARMTIERELVGVLGRKLTVSFEAATDA